MPSLPPGPRSAARQTAAFARDPFGALQHHARRDGAPFPRGLFTGPSGLTGAPEGTQGIFRVGLGALLLPRQPAVYHRPHTELRALGRPPDPDDLVRLPDLGAGCAEALRLCPVVGAITRRRRQPLTWRGYAWPAGLAVGVALPVAHSDPRPSPDPHGSRPKRALERTSTPSE